MISAEPAAESRADWVALGVGSVVLGSLFAVAAVASIPINQYWLPLGTGLGLLMLGVRQVVVAHTRLGEEGADE